MSKTIEIGPYSAYAIAVKYGYVGTEEDWIKAVEAARKSAETSAANAKQKADEASTSAATATEQAKTATTKASESAAFADASASSASAAAISEANAKKYSEEAGAKATTDKTLSIENAPADAKATGDALAGKADKSIVQDESGNAIFYSKAEVEAKIKEILAVQREEDLARIKFWVSNDPTSPASFIGGTWERVENCTIWGASSLHPAGTTLEAGLPNITGRLAIRALKTIYETGVFLTQENGALKSIAVDSAEDFSNLIATEDGTAVYGGSVSIDASRSNPIYGASDTVQPPAYCMYIWRRVA